MNKKKLKKLKKSFQKQICLYNHIPNKKTIRAINETKQGKNLVKCKDLNDLFEKLGI